MLTPRCFVYAENAGYDYKIVKHLPDFPTFLSPSTTKRTVEGGTFVVVYRPIVLHVFCISSNVLIFSQIFFAIKSQNFT